jgi:hypothetical protein
MAGSGKVRKGGPKDDKERLLGLQDILREMSLKTAADALSFKHRLAKVRDGFDGTVIAGADISSVSREAQPRPGEVVYEAVKLQLEIASQIIDFGQRQADFWLDRLQRAGTSMLPPEQRPRLRIAQSCKADDKVRWKLHVYNASQEPRDVILQGRWKRRGWEKDPPDFVAHVEPEGRFTVPPRGERQLEFLTPVVAGRLAPGATYVARVKVRMVGGPRSTLPSLTVGKLELALTVLPP